MESTHPFSVSFAPCFQAVLCRSQLFFRMFLDKLFQICADRFIMKQKRRCFSPFLLSPSFAEGVDRNTIVQQQDGWGKLSPSLRRAWIEIPGGVVPTPWPGVALLAEGVDRNTPMVATCFRKPMVALLAEGVDRNHSRYSLCQLARVALLAEGVDRNTCGVCRLPISDRRPPCGGRG